MWSGVMACYGGSQRFSRESNHTQHETKWDDVTGHDFGTPSTVRAIRIHVMACNKISSHVLNCTYMYMICICIYMCWFPKGLRDFQFLSCGHAPELQSPIQSLRPLPGKISNKTNATLNDWLSCRRSFFKTLRTLLAACIHHASGPATGPPGPQIESAQIFFENKMNISRLRLKLVVY